MKKINTTYHVQISSSKSKVPVFLLWLLSIKTVKMEKANGKHLKNKKKRNEKSKSESKRTKKFTNLNNEMLIYNDSARGSVGFSTFFLRVLPLPRPEP